MEGRRPFASRADRPRGDARSAAPLKRPRLALALLATVSVVLVAAPPAGSFGRGGLLAGVDAA